MRRSLVLPCFVWLAFGLAGATRAGVVAAPTAPELVYSTEGNRLRRYAIPSIGEPTLVEDVLIDRASAGEGGGDEIPEQGFRDVNGQICFFPDGSGRFVLGEDTRQPSPPAGWGVFAPNGRQIGKLTATYNTESAEPHGCAFSPDGVLFTSSVGDPAFGEGNGQLIVWFPPFDRFPGEPGAFPDTDAPSDNFCKLATNLGTAGSVLIDGEGRVYVAQSGAFTVERFSPPFPTSADTEGGCGLTDAQGSPLADTVNRETFVSQTPDFRMATFSGIVLNQSGSLFISSVLTGHIAEYDLDGNLLRFIVEHAIAPLELPKPFGTPQGLALDSDGTLYYADLDLVQQGVFPGPGPNGKVWRVRFDAKGDPMTPEIVREGLGFPDGVTVVPGSVGPEQWPTMAGGPERRFFNPNERILTPENVGQLQVRWRAPTDAIVTASPSVARVELPGEGPTQVVFFQSWDLDVYAVRLVDGSPVWTFETRDQPGASYPNTASITIADLDGAPTVFAGAGEWMYALDAATGAVLWSFATGTGCENAKGQPPGLCGFRGERNEIESTPIVAAGRVFFGMDVNDRVGGKGGFYALDADDGSLAWFFDLESGSTCHPDPGDEVRRFDGYHSAEELGLPSDFFATREGCDFPRNGNGCGNVWSSPAYDDARQLLFVASSNCDTELDPKTGDPFPMPPYDESIFAIGVDGMPAWRWRPREGDNADLAFGALPNLFRMTTQVEGEPRTVDVVGIGGKDGTYYVLGRDGVNEATGVRWDDDPATHLPADLPYWSTSLVPGGVAGGILGTPAVDEVNRLVLIGTAPNDPLNPQQPTVHALDLDTGAIVWDNFEPGAREPASFGSTSATDGVMFVGSVPSPVLRAYKTHGEGQGTQLLDLELYADLEHLLFSAVASGAAVVDGTVLVGTGIGTRTEDPNDLPSQTAALPSDLIALCVPGTAGCAGCDDGVDNDGDELVDHALDPGCRDAADPSEGFDCDDALDNDHDGLVDFPEDPGCDGPLGASEVPEPTAWLLQAAAVAALGWLRGRRRALGR